MLNIFERKFVILHINQHRGRCWLIVPWRMYSAHICQHTGLTAQGRLEYQSLYILFKPSNFLYNQTRAVEFHKIYKNVLAPQICPIYFHNTQYSSPVANSAYCVPSARMQIELGLQLNRVSKIGPWRHLPGDVNVDHVVCLKAECLLYIILFTQLDTFFDGLKLCLCRLWSTISVKRFHNIFRPTDFT